jgi:uncharacterized protein (TIGR02246 family)
MCRRTLNIGFVLALLAGASWLPLARGQEDSVEKEIRAGEEQFVQAFDGGKAAELAAMFMPRGELIDEEGNVTQGTEELAALFTKFFEKFPGAKLALDVESIRPLGSNLAIEEGTRWITVGQEDDSVQAQLRYTAVRVRTQDGRWLIASIRESAEELPPTPHEQLQPLAWIIGEWVNEGSDAAVKITYRWSEDTNYILGDYEITVAGKPAMKSSHRIGWDPLAGKARSWLFDGDGGFSEGQWTEVDDGWVVKSTSVNPDGSTGNATLTVARDGNDKFTMKGTERIVGFFREPDFELAIVRKPPVAAAELK